MLRQETEVVFRKNALKYTLKITESSRKGVLSKGNEIANPTAV